jgi:hypothetical protein
MIANLVTSFIATSLPSSLENALVDAFMRIRQTAEQELHCSNEVLEQPVVEYTDNFDNLCQRVLIPK